MLYRGQMNVPGAPKSQYDDFFAGLDLPIPGGRLNRAGDLRNQNRPGGETETLPTRPMLPSEYGPAIDVKYRQAMGMSGMAPTGNVGFFMGPQIGQGIPPWLRK